MSVPLTRAVSMTEKVSPQSRAGKARGGPRCDGRGSRRACAASTRANGLAELPVQGGPVRADPFLGDEAVGNAVELVAHLLDGAAGGTAVQENPAVGAAETHAGRHSGLCS